MKSIYLYFVLGAFTGLVGCSDASPILHGQDFAPITVVTKTDHDTPVKLVGERLFRETRFAQYYFSHAPRNLNALPDKGDPVVDSLKTLQGPINHPYRGQAISCAACHFVDQLQTEVGGGQRAYTDFTFRSPIPDRGDGKIETPRNSPNMVGSSRQDGFLLHNDGEFATPEDLVRASFFGRNLGWQVAEYKIANAHMAAIVRADDGSYPTETGLAGLSYTKLFAGDPSVPAQFLIPAEYRIDIKTASDAQIVDAVIKLVGGYLRSLDFKRGIDQNYSGSPFDFFLRKNNLPLSPAANQTAIQYSQQLANLLSAKETWNWVSNSDHQFTLHKQDFVFSQGELKGLQVFMGHGQCIQCHAAPDFTDHLFHNTGVSQDEYDSIHGAGMFAQLQIPDLKQRSKKASLYLPASANNPTGQGTFRSRPMADDPLRADLGVWNTFANPDMPGPQVLLKKAICASLPATASCSGLDDDSALSAAIGLIKTPTLRDLGHSDPYFHNGQSQSLVDAVNFYKKIVPLSQKGEVRNVDFRIKNIQINDDDIVPLTKFLQSLNEDYN